MATSHCDFRVLLLFLVGVISLVNSQEKELYLDQAPLINYGEHYGDTLLVVSNDNARRLILPFNITFFGSSYKTIFVSKDGLLSFDSSVQYKAIDWGEGSVSNYLDKPFLAPFYHNGYEPITTSDYQGKIFYRLIDANNLDGTPHESEHKRLIEYLEEYIPESVVNPPESFTARLVLVVTWEDVTDAAQTEIVDDDGNHCGPNTHPCKSATFQAVVVADPENTFAIFNYAKMEIPVTGKYQAGFNGGFRRGWYNVIPCQTECLASLNRSRVNELPDIMGSDIKGRYILSVGHEEIIRGGCLPPELRAGTLEVYPREVGMFGGELLQVSGKCARNSAPVYCKFSYHDPSSIVTLEKITKGKMKNGVKGFCPVPIMSWRGPTKVSWSSDGEEWSTYRTITVVLPSVVPADIEIPALVKQEWYSRNAETITVMWNPLSFSRRGSQAEVEVSLIGYKEFEHNQTVRFNKLKTLQLVDNNAGQYSFSVSNIRCKVDCDMYEQGLLEIALHEDLHSQATRRVALRYGPIPLGWYVNEDLTERIGDDWSDQKCRQWHEADAAQTTWTQHLVPCPCSLDQALADFGRFQPDVSCNLFTGSVCHYHKGAKHCVRSIVPTKGGSGNQCCYNHDGTLRSSQLSYQGSTPDRSHDWGAHPYGIPNHVPSLSHWKHDVVSFYYCCLWNEYELCDLYMEQRPTADCKNYDVPGLGFLRGDPHITTFDQQAGQSYHFGGRGDFWLVQGPGLEIQGRFQSSFDAVTLASEKQSKGSTALTMLAIISDDAPEILVWPAPERALRPRGMDILVQTERRFFYSKSTMWQDFQGGLSVVNNAPHSDNNRHNNFTILFGNNVGVNVVAVNGLLHVTVALPPSMKPQTKGMSAEYMGLLGAYDGKPLNDYTSQEGSVTAIGESARRIYENFAFSWRVEPVHSLFRNQETPSGSYKPYYDLDEIPADNKIPDGTISSTCQGDDNCRWDYAITKKRDIAMATKEANKVFAYTKSSAYRVNSCGLPDVGKMAVMDNYNFSVGQDIKVTGCEGGKFFTGEASFSCVRETVDNAEELERADYGLRRVDENDMEYLIHWVPRPHTVCHTDDPDAMDIVIIIIIAVAALVGLIVIGLVVYCVIMKKRSGSHSPKVKERTSSKDSAVEDPMLRKGPIYRPSSEDVQLREKNNRYQASNV